MSKKKEEIFDVEAENYSVQHDKQKLKEGSRSQSLKIQELEKMNKQLLTILKTIFESRSVGMPYGLYKQVERAINIAT